MVSSVQLLLWETRRHAEMSRPSQGIQRTFPREKVKGMAKPRAKPRPLVAPTVNVIVATSVTGMLLMTGPGETGPDPDGFFLDNWGSGWGSSRGMELALILDPSCTVIFHVLAQVCFLANEPAMKRPI